MAKLRPAATVAMAARWSRRWRQRAANGEAAVDGRRRQSTVAADEVSGGPAIEAAGGGGGHGKVGRMATGSVWFCVES